MFAKLKDLGLRKGYALARKRGVSCPDCGQGVVLPEVMPEGGMKARFGCGECAWEGSFLDTMEMGRAPNSVLEEKPVGSRITREGDRWVIPGTGKLNGEWVFALVWLVFCFAMAIAVPFSKTEGDGPGRWATLLILPFFLVGFFMLYLAYRKTFRKTEVTIDAGGVKVEGRMLAMVRKVQIPLAEVAGVRLEHSYDSESGRSTELMFEKVEGRALKVKVESSVDEMRWLLGEWRGKLGLKESGKVEVKGVFLGKAIQAKGVELEPKENGIFFLTVKNRIAPWALWMGAFTVVIGVIFMTSGSWGDDGAPGIFRVIGVLFAGIGVVVGLVPLVGGLAALWWGWRTLGQVKKYAFYAGRLEYATVKRGGRISANGSLPRDDVKDVVLSLAGESNGDARYKVQVRASENLNLVLFAPIEVAGELEGWVRQWIEAGENS